jgi:hypothetical protein
MLAVYDLPDPFLPEDLHAGMETARVYHLTHKANLPLDDKKE